MIMGKYPCCGGDLCIAVPDESPVMMQEDCPHCGKSLWHRLSRIFPESWLEEDFLSVYEVCEETKSVKPLKKTKPISKEAKDALDKMSNIITDRMAKYLDDILISGDGVL